MLTYAAHYYRCYRQMFEGMENALAAHAELYPDISTFVSRVCSLKDLDEEEQMRQVVAMVEEQIVARSAAVYARRH